MKKLLVLTICILLALSLSSCNSAKKTLDAYNEIGSMTLSDSRFLTEEEREAIRDLREEREKAYRDRDVERLVQIKSEWQEMKAPLQAIFDRYAAADRGLFTDAEIKLLTEKEKKSAEIMTQEIRSAFEAGDRETLVQKLDEIEAFSDGLKQVFSNYERCSSAPLSDNEKKWAPAADTKTYDELKERTEKALKNRDAEEMEKLASEWSRFRETLRKDISDAQDAYLHEAVNGIDFGGSMITLFSLGTLEGSAELQGHTIVIWFKYNVDVDEKKVSSDLDSYLSSYGSYLQTYTNNLKADISDVRLRVEYRSKSGSVLASKEYS